MAEAQETQRDSTATIPASGVVEEVGGGKPVSQRQDTIPSGPSRDVGVLQGGAAQTSAITSGGGGLPVRTVATSTSMPVAPRRSRRQREVEKEAPKADSICPFGVPSRTLGQIFLSESPSALRLPDGMAQLAASGDIPRVELWEGGLQRPPVQKAQPLGSRMPMADAPAYLGPATLVVLVGVAILVRLRYWGHYLLHLSLLRDSRSIRRMELEAAVKMDVFNSVGDILFALTCGYLVWRSVLFFGLKGGGPSIQVYLLAMAFSAGYVLVRFLGLHLGPLLLGDAEAAGTLWRQEEYSARLAWLPLLLIDIVATYSGGWGTSIALLCGLALIALSFLYTWVRIGLTFVGKGYRPFFFFLYFCGLEIIPILLMLKVVEFL